MKQLVVASTFFQCLTLVAAIDAGALPAADERILVLADGSQVPELTLPLAEQAGFSVVASRFDRVVDLATLLYPRRPVQFAPRLEEHLIWERLLRSHWQLGDEPVQVPGDEQPDLLIDGADLAVNRRPVHAELVGDVLHRRPANAVTSETAGRGIEEGVELLGRGRGDPVLVHREHHE